VLDRLSREGALKALQHLDRLEGYGIGFRSFTEPYFDSCGIFKEAVVSIVATLAKQERIKRSERTKAGLARVRSEGRRLGRPKVAVNSADIARLRAQGLSLESHCASTWNWGWLSSSAIGRGGVTDCAKNVFSRPPLSPSFRARVFVWFEHRPVSRRGLEASNEHTT
jgi:hypothetical protein